MIKSIYYYEIIKTLQIGLKIVEYEIVGHKVQRNVGFKVYIFSKVDYSNSHYI